MDQPSPISLVRLAPEPECDADFAHRLAADLADILNHDEGLPKSIRPGLPSPLATAESVLSYTRDWCLARNSLFHAIVVDGQQAIGSISLSHIDLANRSARSGYWLGSAHQDRGYGSEALRQALARARTLGLTEVSAMIPAEHGGSERIWEKLGAEIIPAGGEGRSARIVLPPHA